ncbi:MAG: ATP synthase F0 subunit B [Clostridiales bacterium]|nr:ATP synthase F0 subunit B [Clostridiales bacterium]
MTLPLNIDWQQILLHLFNFAILAGGLYFLLYNPVKSFMEKREAYYQEMDKNAREHLEQAERLKTEREEQLRQVDQEMEQHRAQAAQAAEQEAQQTIAQARKKAEQLMEKARANTELEHEKMLQSARREMTDLAVTATENLLLQSESDPYDQFLGLVEGKEAREDD